MTPEACRRAYERQFQNGEPVTLSRVNVDGTFGPIRARVTNFAPDDIVFDVQQGDRKVILLAQDVETSGFPLPFVPDQDRIDWNGVLLTVKSVDDATRRIAGVMMAFEIQVAGG